MSNSYILPMDRTLSGAITPGHSGLRSDDNEGVFLIAQRSGITEASPSECFISYPGHSLGRILPLYSRLAHRDN